MQDVHIDRPLVINVKGILGGRDFLVELGAQSMKFHFEVSHKLKTARLSYALGHDVYATGEISVATIRGISETLESVVRDENPPDCMCIATSAVRDARNGKFLVREIRKLGLDVRVLTGLEETLLIAQGYVNRCRGIPALVADVGGGSVEVVYLNRNQTMLRDSLPLGAIRLHYIGRRGHATWSERQAEKWIETQLSKAALVVTDEVFGIGGTIKAIATTLGKRTFNRIELLELEARVRTHGTPVGLKRNRARVFPPGLLVTRKLLEFTRAERITYLKGVSVGRAFLQEYQRRPWSNGQSFLRIISDLPRNGRQRRGGGQL